MTMSIVFEPDAGRPTAFDAVTVTCLTVLLGYSPAATVPVMVTELPVVDDRLSPVGRFDADQRVARGAVDAVNGGEVYGWVGTARPSSGPATTTVVVVSCPVSIVA